MGGSGTIKTVWRWLRSEWSFVARSLRLAACSLLAAWSLLAARCLEPAACCLLPAGFQQSDCISLPINLHLPTAVRFARFGLGSSAVSSNYASMKDFDSEADGGDYGSDDDAQRLDDVGEDEEG